MKKDSLLEDFEVAFNTMKNDLGFSATLDDLEEVFFFKDMVLQAGFVSPRLSRMICGRIRDTFSWWVGQLHAWLMPNPSSMIGISESQAFTDEERDVIGNIMKQLMAFTSRNILIGLAKDKEGESKYIDDALSVWNECKPTLLTYAKKVNNYWTSEE